MGFNIGNAFKGIGDKIAGPFKKIGDMFKDIGQKFISIFKKLAGIGNAIKAFFEFIGYCFEWFFTKYIPWFFVPWPSTMFNPKRSDMGAEAGVLPWLLRYIVIGIFGLILFPKCFIWYLLNTFLWLLYLPFRFIFWIIGSMTGMKIEKMERDLWEFMNSIDYFIHGPKNNYFIHQFSRLKNPNADPVVGKLVYTPFNYTSVSGNEVEIDVFATDLSSIEDDKDSLNLGFHIIHFPNGIMNTCFTAIPYRMARVPEFDKSKIKAMKMQ